MAGCGSTGWTSHQPQKEVGCKEMALKAPQLSLPSLLPTTKPLKPGQTKEGTITHTQKYPPHEGSQTPQAATCTHAQRQSEPPRPPQV